MNTSPDARAFSVVFVCTGNQARSPLAERLFRLYATAYGARSLSCGTDDVGPMPALPSAIEAGRLLGVDLTAHRARALHTVDFSQADLVVGFELSHVVAAVVDGGSPPARTFLLGELIELLDSHEQAGNDPHEIARLRVGNADGRRVRSRPDAGAAIVADPLGKPANVMRRTAMEIDVLVRKLVSGLFGSPDGTLAAHDAPKTWRWRRR